MDYQYKQHAILSCAANDIHHNVDIMLPNAEKKSKIPQSRLAIYFGILGIGIGSRKVMSRKIYITSTFGILVAAILAFAFFSLDKNAYTIAALVAVVVLLGLNIKMVKCPNCGARPVVYMFAVWTLLLDFPLFIADSLLLRRCPKCRKEVFDKSA